MKRLVLALIALIPLTQVSANAQGDPSQNSHREDKFTQQKRDLDASRFAVESLRRELAMVVEQNNQRKIESEHRVLTAIESELKAKLILDAAQVNLREVQRELAEAEQRIQEQRFNMDAQKNELEEQIASLQSQLNQASKKPNRVEADLKTAIYVAENMEGHTLADLASQAFGHMVSYTEVDAVFSHASSAKRQRFTAVSRGNQVLVTDFPDQLDKAISLLLEIDASFSDTKNISNLEASPQVVFYKPKALNAHQVMSLIATNQGDGPSAVRSTEVPGTGSVRIEGHKKAVDQALAVLGLNDNFPPQVRLRAWLIHSNAPADLAGVTLPEKLTSGLQGALPGQRFVGLASMLMQTSVGSGQHVRAATMPSPSASFPVGEWVFTAGMKSYDSDAGVLSLEQCSFEVELASRTERLSADLLLRKDEFTVVGSIQGGSMSLVLTFEEI